MHNAVKIALKVVSGMVAVIFLVVLWVLWNLGIIQALYNCDTTDYSPLIKKVAVPMQQELESFYATKRRFPTTQERDAMLERVGCKMEGSVCLYEGGRVKIISQESSCDYYIKFRVENTGCSLYLNNIGREKGKVSRVRCGNKPCINLKQ